MPFTIQHDLEQDCLRATFTDRLTISLVHEFFTTAATIIKETGCRRLLSDCRQVKVHLSALEIMQFPKLAAATPLIAKSKRAVLAPRGTSGYELYEMLSDSTYMRVFHQQEKAIEWLQKDTCQTTATAKVPVLT